MSSKLKTAMFEEESALEKIEKEQVEVIGDTIDESLRLAAKHFGKELYQLDYEVIERGSKSLFFSHPYRIRVFVTNHEDNIQELASIDKKLTGGSGKLLSTELKKLIIPKDKDGWVSIKYYRHGLYMKEIPPVGNGKYPTVQDVVKKLNLRGIAPPNEASLQSFLDSKSPDYVRFGDAKLKPFAEAGAKVEISDDNMKAFVTLLPPKLAGRDLEVADVVYELKKEDIVYGIREDVIREFLELEKYNEPFVAASGDPPMHGKNAQIVYHVRTDKKVVLKEDASGKVDYKDLDLIENVVVGQLLAEKTPPEKGKYGRNLFNEMLEAKDGQDIPLNQGKGTILSEDKMKLTAEVNGQVIFAEDRLSVETVYRISGDVNMRTGNITFLGSIIITGNIEDNFQVKASGNIEIYGTVQKAQIEADGDIIIRQGVTGRGEARIESTGGNVVSKFLQDAIVVTEKDVIVQEVIMNCDVSAGGKVTCNGKKANILGGRIRAGTLISAKNIGSPANPYTELIVGVNPKLLKQIEDYTAKRNESQNKLELLTKSLKTMKARQEEDPSSFSEENAAMISKFEVGIKKLEKRIAEYDKEIQTVISYMEQAGDEGKVYFEKKMYGGVSVRIKNAEPYKIKNDLQSKILFLSENKIQMKPYADPDSEGGQSKRPGRRK